MQRQGSLGGLQLSRITFTEVTKAAVTDAMQSPREVSKPLVEAYLARRALDYLVGFSISPILWRKLPGARSAGRLLFRTTLLAVAENQSKLQSLHG